MSTVSLEDIIEIEVDIPAEDNSYEHDLKNQEILKDIQDEIEDAGGVNHELAITLENIFPGVIAKRTPLNSFTKRHSRTNLDVTLESIGETAKWIKTNIIDKAIEYIKKIIAWFVDLFGNRKKDNGAAKTAQKAKQRKEKTDNNVKEGDKKFNKEDAKRITTDDFVEAFKEDMEKGLELDLLNKATSVGDLYTKLHTRILASKLKGRISKFANDFMVESNTDISEVSNKIVGLAATHGKRIFLEAAAIQQAIEDKEEFVMANMSLDKRNYFTALSKIEALKPTGDLEDTPAVVAQLKEKLKDYMKPDPAYDNVDMSKLDLSLVELFANGARDSKLAEVSRTLLDVDNGLTKMQVYLKGQAKDTDVATQSHVEAVNKLRDEIIFVITMVSMPGFLETYIVKLAEQIVKVEEIADKMIARAFNKVANSKDMDPDLKQRLTDYIKTILTITEDED